MKCLECGSDEVLMGVVTIRKALPLALKGGSIKVGGFKVSQIDIKNIWDKDVNGDDKRIRGPIQCSECGTEHFYVAKSKNSLRKGSYLEAIEQGYESLVEGE